MMQYHQIKARYKDALLFFQVGDFYELFFDDAVVASRFLAITLTKRGKNEGQDIPLCGVPVHALNFYLTKLVKGGFSVALCDQLSKPQPGTVVERAVTKVYTPGTLTDDHMLQERRASYICAVATVGRSYEIVAVELLTAHMLMTAVPADDLRGLEAELARYAPDEIVVVRAESPVVALLKKWSYVVTAVETAQRGAAAVLREYLGYVQPAIVAHLGEPAVYEPTQYVALDAATQRNIALVVNSDEGSGSFTLCNAVDGTVTGMGARLLKKWLVRPLRHLFAIERRQDLVSLFVRDVTLMARIQQTFSQISDVERIVGRIALLRATIADYRALKTSLTHIEELRHLLLPYAEQSELAYELLEALASYDQLRELLEQSVYDDQAEEWLIKPGYRQELDRLRELSRDGHSHIQRYAAAEAARCNISSLKILYTSVSGYFIEITKTHADKVPQEYRHIQTLAGRDRFVTAELSALERELQSAQQAALELEKKLYGEVEVVVRSYAAPLRKTAQALAQLDVLQGFASVATKQRYVRPQFSSERRILIKKGRHPVVEQALERGHFVANDTLLNHEESLWIVTGPNMGGKSTYLRQVALIVLLAHCGAFVPAESAQIMLVDRIFTRIGAGDNVAQGKSTFLVEMEESATICTQATADSLVILDEVGRGTSTEDGRAIAQAIIEYLVHRVGCFTLFATHYHELTALAVPQSGMVNHHVVCHKEGDVVHFLHRVARGPAPASFGIEVARLAKLPHEVVLRARQLVKEGAPAVHSSTALVHEHVHENRPCACQELCDLDVDNLSPRQAHLLLSELKEKALAPRDF